MSALPDHPPPVSKSHRDRPGAMSGERPGYEPRCDAAEWDRLDRLSSTRLKSKEEKPYVEIKRGVDAHGDGIRMFMQDSEDSAPSCQVEEVAKFCEGARLEDLKSGAGAAGQRYGAWLDDRSSPRSTGVGSRRNHPNPLTATGLYRLLKVARFDNGELPDADRRLIYITDLDPYYIFALTETATQHQVAILRDALWNHIKLRTSIRATINPLGFQIPSLEFYLPYFALRTSLSPIEPPTTAVNSKRRKWKDLSFLQMPTPTSQRHRKWGIHQAQISLAISGSCNWRWVAYAFNDTDFDGKDLRDAGDSYGPLQEEPIASNCIDANRPNGCPREYFLTIFNIRMVQVLGEWEYLVGSIESSIKNNDSHTPTLTRNSGSRQSPAEDEMETYDRTIQTIILLDQLLRVISELNDAWNRFSSLDIGYFLNGDPKLDTSQGRNLLIHAISNSFERLRGVQKTLIHLQKSCEAAADILNMKFSLETSQAARQNGVITEATALIISPFALAAAYFSIPQAAIPFKLNSKSFVISIFVIMIAVRLSFILLGSFLRRTWKQLTSRVTGMKLDEFAQQLFAFRRGRNVPGRDTDGVEMELMV